MVFYIVKVGETDQVLSLSIDEMFWKLIRIIIQVIIDVFVLVYAEIRFFIVTCVLYSRLTNQYQRFTKVSHPRHEQLGNSRTAIGGFSINTLHT